MMNFCKECGKEVSAEHSHCRHCGTATHTNEIVVQNSVQKEPMTKKGKVILGSVISVIVILVSVHMWTNNHFSYETVEKRFVEAVEKNESKKIAKLAIHEDGSAISEQEAKAFASLVKTGGKVHLTDLKHVVLDGKFLGIYDSYKVELVDQFVTYDNFVEGLNFTFNEEEFPIHQKGDTYITYGPLAPGEYEVEAKFVSDAGETSIDDSIIAASTFGEPARMDIDIPISMVSFHVDNYYYFDTSDAYILHNDEEYKLTEGGELAEVGPFIIDGTQHVNVVVSMPWGKITSEDIPIDDSHMYVSADLISNEDYEEVTKVLTSFGDAYVNALANKTTKPLTMGTGDFKEAFAYTFEEDSFYTGQFKELQVDKSSLSINLDSETPEINIDAKYLLSESVHSLLDDSKLYEEEYTWNMNVVFNDKKWLIHSLMYASILTEDSELDTIAGTNTVYGPNEETIQAAKMSSLEEEMEAFMIEYTIASVDAINERYFDTVGRYITEKGPRRKEASEYIDYLDSKDIFEEWLGTELEKVEEIDENSWKVTVLEEFDIIKPDTSNVKSFRTVVVVKLIDGNYYVDELLETNEI